MARTVDIIDELTGVIIGEAKKSAVDCFVRTNNLRTSWWDGWTVAVRPWCIWNFTEDLGEIDIYSLALTGGVEIYDRNDGALDYFRNE